MAVLVILLGIFALFVGLLVIWFSGAVAGGVPLFAGLLSLFEIGLGALTFASLYLLLGAGLLAGKGWAWMLGMIVGIASLPVIAIAGILFLYFLVVTVPTMIVSLGIWGSLLYYLTRPHVKAFFGRAVLRGPAVRRGAVNPTQA